MLSDWECKVIQRSLEDGLTVMIALPAGSIVVEQIDNFCNVGFLGNKIHGKKITAVWFDDYPNEREKE